MKIEIIDTPIRFHLHGKAAAVANDCYGEVGMRLMNEVWKSVKEHGTPTMGINHWVYLSDGSMFVGVELPQGANAPDGLEAIEFELPRYLKHLHVGPYQALPEKWKSLKAEITARGDSIASPSLEIYGHHGDDPSKLETTILIALRNDRQAT